MEEREALTPEEAIRAMVNGETLIGYGGIECRWDTDRFVFSDPKSLGGGALPTLYEFRGLYRRSAPKKRLMTRFECLAWVQSDRSRGWLVRYHFDWELPSHWGYRNPEDLQRARLLPDLSGIDGSTICRFEVKESV